MFIQAAMRIMRHKHVTLSMVLTFGLAGQMFAGTSLSCAGYPKNVPVFSNSGVSTFVQVCKIVALTAPLTPSLSVTSNIGNVKAHGGQTENAIPVYARIVAQDATLADAAKLANSVHISTENGAVSSPKITVNYPRSLEIDYEVFTPSSTDLSLVSAVGNVSADSYTSKLSAVVDVGDLTLHTIDGDVNAKVATGNITISLSGAAWMGDGLTATTLTGNILFSRPKGYQALITATAGVGAVDVDGKTKAFPFPATITTGSGRPIKLTTSVGVVTVRTN